MVSKSKWIEIHSPDEPASKVAGRAVDRRLELVWRHLPPAAREADEQIEHVHQLRVSSRRAKAALDIFDEFLPAARKFWFLKQLKRIRRAAGVARDLDVFGMRLLSSCPDHLAEPCAALRKRVRQQRQEAQEPIHDIHARLADKGFKRRVTKFVERIHYRNKGQEPLISCFARARIEPVLQNFFTAAEADFSDTTALHQFRIFGKQLRYTMEIFAGAFGQTFRDDLYPLVEELQEKLGQINDHATALTHLHRWLSETDDDGQSTLIHSLMDAESDALAQAQAKFTAWWTPDWAAELRRRFNEELAEASV